MVFQDRAARRWPRVISRRRRRRSTTRRFNTPWIATRNVSTFTFYCSLFAGPLFSSPFLCPASPPLRRCPCRPALRPLNERTRRPPIQLLARSRVARRKETGPSRDSRVFSSTDPARESRDFLGPTRGRRSGSAEGLFTRGPSRLLRTFASRSTSALVTIREYGATADVSGATGAEGRSCRFGVAGFTRRRGIRYRESLFYLVRAGRCESVKRRCGALLLSLLPARRFGIVFLVRGGIKLRGPLSMLHLAGRGT